MDKEGGQTSGEEPKNPMTKDAASRIQSAEAKQHGGKVEIGGFAARAQSSADKRENKKKNKRGKKSGGGNEKGSFASRAQSAADTSEHENKGKEGQRFVVECKNPESLTKDATLFQSAAGNKHGGGVENESFSSCARNAADN